MGINVITLCNSAGSPYNVLSLQISRAISTAYMEYLKAHAMMADIQLKEFSASKFTLGVNEVPGKLLASCNQLEGAMKCITELTAEMKRRSYQEPTKQMRVDLPTMAKSLAGAGLANELALQHVANILEAGSTYDLLEECKHQVGKIRLQTVTLDEHIKILAKRRDIPVHKALEKNDGKILQCSAKLDRDWIDLIQTMQAAGVFTAELYYQHADKGSLTK